MGRTGADRWLPLLLAFLPPAHAASGHPAYLYVVSNIIKEFGSDAAYQAALHAALVPMLSLIHI